MLQNQNRLGENKEQARINARKELDTLIPLQTKVNFTKTPQDRFLVRRSKRDFKNDISLKMGMSLKTNTFKDILKAYQKEHQQIIYLQ